MKISTVAALALTVLAGACARQDVHNAHEKAAPAAAPSGDWPMYGGPLAGDRYSPLTQVTAANVGRLRQVCAFDAPDVVNFQSGIVAVNGVLYFTLFNNTYAVDGKSRPARPSRIRGMIRAHFTAAASAHAPDP